MRPIGSARGQRRHGGLPLRGVRELVPVPAVRAEAVAAQQVAPAPAHILRGASSRLPSFSHRSVRTAASSPFLRASSTPHIRVHALTASFPSSNQSRQVRRSGERGVDITVGAVGFLHVRDVVVRFHDGPIERVVVGDLLYTSQLLALRGSSSSWASAPAACSSATPSTTRPRGRRPRARRAFDGTGGSIAPVVGGRVHRPVPVSRAAEHIQPWLRPEIRPDHPKSRIPRAGVVRRSSSIQGVRRWELR